MHKAVWALFVLFPLAAPAQTTVLYLGAAAPLLDRLFPTITATEQLQLTPDLILGVLQFSLAAAFLALWRAAPDYRVFRSLGIFFAIACTLQLVRYGGGVELDWTLIALAVAVLVEAAGEAMQVPHRGWTRWFWPVYALAGIVTWFPKIAFLRDLSILSAVPLGILIAQGLRQKNRRDRMIASAFSVYFLVRLTQYTVFQKLAGTSSYITIGGWRWQSTPSAITLLGLVTLVIFIRDLIHDRAEKQRLAAELAAARSVQQYLLPAHLPHTPGLFIESNYVPAREVGGDFFQVLPQIDDGSVLIVIGDVAGKGVEAGMMATLIVGAIRTATAFTSDPARILALLNERLRGRGLVTCLALRIERDGSATLVNAGHLPPYLNRNELAMEGALPLGAVPEFSFPVSRFQLSPGDSLILMTDGVAEAQDAQGQLLGFDRISDLLRCGATGTVLAEAAQQFGQQDDITVLTVTRVETGEPSSTELAVPALAPA